MKNATALESMLPAGEFSLDKIRYFIIATISVFLALYHLYVGMFGAPPGYVFKAVHLGAAQALVFLMVPWKKTSSETPTKFTFVDLICVCITIFTTLYMIINHEDWHLKIAHLTAFDFVLGCLMILLIWEGTRRTIGLPMVIVSILFLVNAIYTDLFFGIFHGPPHSWEYVITVLFVEEAGIFGIPVAVMAAYVVLFLIFASLLLNTGVGKFFTQIAFAFFGHRVGGPAKAAVVSSAMMGTISGSAIGNVVTTGSFTIPLMKRMGYSSEFAAGVEATASTGGQFMPPIMGAVAFIMAEFMGVSYVKVALAATIPAILFFLGIFAVVHFRATKSGLMTVPQKFLPNAWKILRRDGYLILPLLLIIFVLLLGYSIIYVAMIGIASTFILSFARKSTRLTPLQFIQTLEKSISNTVPLTMTCACAGIIIGSVFITGLSWRLSYTIIDISMGQLWLVLLFTMILSIILGMGLTTSAVYITLVAIIIPVLEEMGVVPMAAHLFSLYYGILSCITPPVAIAAYAASGVANSDPMKTGIQASLIGIIGFFVPFLFVYGPELLMIGKPAAIFAAFVTGLLGCVCMAAVVEAWLLRKTTWYERLSLFAAAVFLLVPDLVSDTVGIAIFLVVVFLQKKVKITLKEAIRGLKSASVFSRSNVPGREPKEPVEAYAAGSNLNQGEQIDESLIAFLQMGSTPEANMPKSGSVSSRINFLLWTILCCVAAGLFVLAKYNAHVLYLRSWLAALLIASLIIVITFWLLLGKRHFPAAGESK